MAEAPIKDSLSHLDLLNTTKDVHIFDLLVLHQSELNIGPLDLHLCKQLLQGKLLGGLCADLQASRDGNRFQYLGASVSGVMSLMPDVGIMSWTVVHQWSIISFLHPPL